MIVAPLEITRSPQKFIFNTPSDIASLLLEPHTVKFYWLLKDGTALEAATSSDGILNIRLNDESVDIKGYKIVLNDTVVQIGKIVFIEDTL